MNRQYGVVLIGCGHIGEEHIADIYYREGITVVGVVDKNLDRAKEFARKYQAKTYAADYKEYLKREDVDIVIIATYVNSHLEILRDCLNAGKHVICEKPITASIEDGLEFVRLVKSSPCKVMVSYILRCNETYQKAAELIQSGVIGNIKTMRMVQNHHCKDWERYKLLLRDCSPIVDCGVHYMDVMQWFTGSEIESVDGFGAILDDDLPQGVYNYGVINVKLKNGAVGYYEAGWSKNLASCNIKEFVGDKGRLSITLNYMRSKDIEEGDLIELYLNEGNQYITININTKYKNMWAQFERLVDMIENNAPAVPNIDEVYSAFDAVMQADSIVRSKLGL